MHLESYWRCFYVFESFQEFILVFLIQRKIFLVLNLIESVFTYLNHFKVHSIFLIQRKIFLVLKRCSSYCLHRFSLNQLIACITAILNTWKTKIHLNFHEDKEAVLFIKSCLILNSLIETEVHLESYWKCFYVFESV